MSEATQAIYNLKMVHKQLIVYYISRYNTKMVRKGIKVGVVNTVVPVVNTDKNTKKVRVVNTDKNTKKVRVEFMGVRRERNSTYECDCGKELLWGGMELHITSKKHRTIMGQQPLQQPPLEEPAPQEPTPQVIVPTIQVIEQIPICTEIIQPKKIKKVFRIIKKPNTEYNYDQEMLDDHNNGTGMRMYDTNGM